MPPLCPSNHSRSRRNHICRIDPNQEIMYDKEVIVKEHTTAICLTNIVPAQIYPERLTKILAGTGKAWLLT